MVETRLVLKEELHIKHTDAEDVEVPVTLRKQRAGVERLGPDSTSQRNQGETND